MKRIAMLFLLLACVIASGHAQQPPKVSVLQYTQLPASFYKEGDSNLITCALSYDGKVAVQIQANFAQPGEGRRYDIATGRQTTFWKNSEIKAGQYTWFAREGYIRLSHNGSVVVFDAYVGGKNKTPADPWGAAVIVKPTSVTGGAKIFDLKQFLKSRDPDIDGARGISGMDMNTDGSVIYVTVPYHKKGDSDHARSYPVRVAVIEINPNENKMTLHSTASSGEQYYPFGTITTNASGKTFSYKGAGPGGKDTCSYLFTGQWVERFGHYPVTGEKMTGVNAWQDRGGPVIMGKGDGSYVFIHPQEKGPVIAFNWRSKGILKFGTSQTGTWSIPSYADGRFASYDGDHLFYMGGSDWVWFDLQKSPCILVPQKPQTKLSIPLHNNVFMSEDGSTLLLLEGKGNTRRLVVLTVAAPG
ncbi:MAG: hypothetical protein JW881_15370 [Spirochaetales bacterium]|nr:hypothetical protein [Spirochaetales bacterium]